MKNLHRLKTIPADAGKTNKWSTEQLGIGSVTIVKWYTNTKQSRFADFDENCRFAGCGYERNYC